MAVLTLTEFKKALSELIVPTESVYEFILMTPEQQTAFISSQKEIITQARGVLDKLDDFLDFVTPQP